jgi:hypothetical protein
MYQGSSQSLGGMIIIIVVFLSSIAIVVVVGHILVIAYILHFTEVSTTFTRGGMIAIAIAFG